MPQNKARLPGLAFDQLFALKYVHDARQSSTGRHVAYVISHTSAVHGSETFQVFVRDILAGTEVNIDFPGNATCPRWSPDGSAFAFIGQSGTSASLYLVDAGSFRSRAVLSEGQQISGPPSWSPDGAHLAYTTVTQRAPTGVRRIKSRVFRAEGIGFVENLEYTIQVLDVQTKVSRSLAVGMSAALQPVFSPCGRRLLFLGSKTAVAYASFGGLNLFVADLSSGEVSKVLGEEWFVATAAWAPSGERIVVAGDRSSPLTVPSPGLWVVSTDGHSPECRTEGCLGTVGLRMHHDMPTWNTSQNWVFTVPNSAQAYATVTHHGRAEIFRISLDGPTNFEPVISGNRCCIVTDSCAKTSQLLYCASDMHRPWELYLSDMLGNHERQITRLNASVLGKWPELNSESLTIESPDGVVFDGWHLARSDCEGPQPTVLFIHGGPFLSAGHIFRFDFHLLAANGYAVLFSNFRGSVGYGEPFTRAIMGDWGARAYPDHIATIDAAVARGLADSDRLGVWGASHGGFATAWIVGHSSRFRAAVAESSATNFATLYYLSDDPDVFVRDLGGRPDEIPDVYRSRSPLAYAARCRTPTLLLHGEKDLRCPLTEAEQFYRALHDASCTTELVVVPGMEHLGDSIGPLAARQGQNEALLEWFQRFL